MSNPADGFEIDVALLSDVGCVRETNEDAGVIVNRAKGRRLAGDGMLVVVADGMGGHEAGEVASRAAVEWIPRIYFDAAGDRHEALARAFAASNAAIFSDAEQNPARAGMGTTAVALALRDGCAYIAHVGDSRAYRLNDGEAQAMTRDHSMVRDLVDRGLLTEAAAEAHPDKNVILRALGTRPEVDVELLGAPLRLHPGDGFLLCSDGMSDLASDQELFEGATTLPAHDACRVLIDLARKRGAHDNVTVGVVHVHPAGSGSAAAAIPDTRGGTGS